jgi:hypothetical protein
MLLECWSRHGSFTDGLTLYEIMMRLMFLTRKQWRWNNANEKSVCRIFFTKLGTYGDLSRTETGAQADE